MKIKNVTLKDFKRFADLTVEEIPETAKLVILTGPNGSGKSSFFEGLNLWKAQSKFNTNFNLQNDTYYYVNRDFSNPEDYNDNRVNLRNYLQTIIKNGKLKIEFYNQQNLTSDLYKHIHVRGPYRNEAQINTSAQPSGYELRLIDNDNTRVSLNHKKIIDSGAEKLYDEQTTGKELENINKSFFKMNEYLGRVIEDLKVVSVSKNKKPQGFLFDKNGKKIEYQNLSAGEKSVFDLMLDIIANSDYFNNTVYCIDEPEAHLNSKVQGDMLRVLFEMIPDNCQLWLATHSIGMMRVAFDLYKTQPEKVAFLDFGNKDFNKPQSISPVTPNRSLWKDMLELALDDLSELIAPSQIILCEGRRAMDINKKETAFDESVYTTIFSEEKPETLFISVGNRSDVDQHGDSLKCVIKKITKESSIIRLIDRDDKTERQRTQKNESGVRVLSWRNIESYLINEEVLRKFCVEYGKDDIIDSVLKALSDAKAESIRARNKPDDMSQVAGKLYKTISIDLGLTQMGDSPKDFMRDILAPLITKDMKVYRILENDIFGESS